MNAKPAKSNPGSHPRQTANLVSLVTFYYSFCFFRKGYKKELDENDLYDVLSTCRSKTLGEQLELQWQVETRNQNPSVVRVLWKSFGMRYLLFGVVHLCTRLILILSVPEALGKVISFFCPDQTEISQEEALYYALTAIALLIFNFLYTQNYLLLLTEFGIKIRTAICSHLYRKALKMTERSLAEIGIGKIVTLITKDVQAIETIVLFGNDIWVGLVQTGVICYLIYRKIGVAAFAGVGFFFVVLPLQVFITKLSATLRLKTTKKTDERLQLTHEALTIIKTIKMYTWESFFCQRIKDLRRKELDSIFKLYLCKIVVIVLGGLCSKIAFYLLVMTHIWMGFYFTAELVYFVKICLHKLRHLFSIMLPLCLLFGAEFSATLVRLRTVLTAEEVAEEIVTTKETVVHFNKVSIKIGDTAVLKDVTMRLTKGLYMVVGRVGSGKSSFIKAALGELKVDGGLSVGGRLSYVSQDPWLFPSTIKNNILFGSKLDRVRYRKVLDVCDLNQDLRCFNDGDNTLLGDNGVNLSKGQQARVNLARALYKDADIYLVDDCFAALDALVSDHIFKKCLVEFLKDKLCLFVCNKEEYVTATDGVITIVDGSAFMTDNTQLVRFQLTNNKEDRHSGQEPNVIESPKNLYQEEKKDGKVDMDTYKKYIHFGGGYIVFGMITTMFLVVQINVTYSEQLVSSWVTLEQNLSTYHLKNMTNSSSFVRQQHERGNILNVYTIIIVASTGLSLIKSLGFFNFNRKASINLHKLLISRILNAKMTFFDSNLMGSVLNRFSKDLSTVDDHLPLVMNECFEFLFVLLGIVVLVATVKCFFLLPAGFFFVVAYLARFVYLKTGRSLQRLEASTRSPLIGHLNTSLQGLTTIRALRAQEMIKDEFDRHHDLYTSVNYSLHNSSRALSFALDGMSAVFIATVVLRFVMVKDETSVGDVGMAITQALHLTSLLQYGIRRWADLESQMTSVERVLQYTRAEQEDAGGKRWDNWPRSGQIDFVDVSLEYNNHKVLRNVNFSIKPKQKLCIVGRTGAGKSSLLSCLFRLYDIDGVVRIDNVNTNQLSLECLRSNISVIPQEPVVISGSLRDNIDPMKRHADSEVSRVLKIVNLDFMGLDDEIGSSLSTGQKQLVCLARALIRRNKIVVLDEPTGSLDNRADCLVQKVIKENFGCRTLVVVAHRMSSVLGCDLAVVMEGGRVVEADKPCRLLKMKKSLFSEIFKVGSDQREDVA